jgi:hypothetical protein
MRNNFVWLSAFLTLLLSFGVVAILISQKPTDILIAIVICMVWLIVFLGFAVIYYVIRGISRFETSRKVFRTGLKVGSVLASIVIILLGLQIIFDLI